MSASTLSITQDGGHIEFDLDESLYEYNDTIYYALYIEDLAGNSNNDHGDGHSFLVNDSISPVIFQDPSNNDDSNYYCDKYLIFDISEPSEASGVNDSSIELWFEVGSFSGAYSQSTGLFSKDGISYNFTIQKSGNFTFGDTVYYKVNGTDLSDKQNVFSASGQFDLIDLEAPYITYLGGSSNNTIAEYNKNVRITFESDEVDEYGAGFGDIYLLIKNGSAPVEDGPNTYRIDWYLNNSGEYSFLIDSDYLSARTGEELYYRIKAMDVENNNRTAQGMISPEDLVAPSILYVSDNSTANELNYHEDFGVTFTISEPRSGIGFDPTTDNLDLYYYIGTSEPLNPLSGTKVSFDGVIAIGGGNYMIVLPESAYAYTDRVYFWANATDDVGNVNSTFESGSLQYIEIIDAINPELILDASATDPSSYHLGKNIDFDVIEPSDASGMATVTLYYGLQNPSVSPASNNGSIIIDTIAHGGGSLIISIPAYATDGNYTKRMYFMLIASDNVGNDNTSSVYSFIISDGLEPNIAQDEKNYRPVMKNNYGKTLNITVWDPDYPLASGMDYIRLYYELDNPAVTTGSSHLDIEEPSVVESMDSYTFRITYGLMQSWSNGTRFYYMIEIRDVDGNTNYSEIKSFLVVDAFSQDLLSPSSSDPSSFGYYYNDGNISLEFTVETPCELWYWIDGAPNPGDEAREYGTQFSREIEFTEEGNHNITIFYFDWEYNQTIEFYMDFTAPPAVDLSSIVINDGGYIQISWTFTGEEDSLTRYQIYRRQGSDDWILVDTKGAGTNTYTDFYVEEGKSYEYRIIVIDRADNTSPISNQLSIRLPLPIYIWFIAAGVALVVGVAAFVVTKRMRTKRELRKLTSLEGQDVDFDVMDAELDDEKVRARHERLKAIEEADVFEDDISEDAWQSADWRSRSGSGKYDRYSREDLAQYWGENVKNLVEKAAKFEIDSDLPSALQVYKIALRAAEIEPNSNPETITYLRNKIFDIYSNSM